MAENQQQVILPDSPEAARYVTDLRGWLSRDGLFYGDHCDSERIARRAGATHFPCDDCGATCEKPRVRCDRCRRVAAAARYAAYPEEDPVEGSPLYSDAADRFFSDWDDVELYLDELRLLEDADLSVEDLRLQCCEPVHCPELCADWIADDLGEDQEVPPEIQAAMDQFNQAVAGVLISWRPKRAKVRLSRSPTEAATE